MKDLVPLGAKIDVEVARRIDLCRGTLSRSEWLREAIAAKLGVSLDNSRYDRGRPYPVQSVLAEEPAEFNASPAQPAKPAKPKKK